MSMPNDEIRKVLARAQEIQSTERPDQLDVEAIVHAAAEVGITRTAVERAIRERSQLPAAPPAVGDFVFAQSADGKYYVAEVKSVSEDTLRVQFLQGSEHTVSGDEIKAFAMLPGMRVICNWPWWG